MQKLVEITKESVNVITQAVNQAKSFVEAGVAHKSDQLMAEVRLAEAKNNVVRAENGFALAKAGLNMLMGAPLTAKYDLVPLNVELPKMTKPIEELIGMSEVRRSELKLLDYQVDIADRGVKVAYNGFIPESGIFYQWTFQSGNDTMPGASWAAGAVANLTFWEWGKTYDKIKSAQHTYKESKAQRDYAREGISLQVKQAYLDLIAAEQVVATGEATMKEARESHRVWKMKYDAQMATMVDLLTATMMMQKADIDYYVALYDYGIALSQLSRAVESKISEISSAEDIASQCRN
jgi:outer membrane protein TolC